MNGPVTQLVVSMTDSSKLAFDIAMSLAGVMTFGRCFLRNKGDEMGHKNFHYSALSLLIRQCSGLYICV